jgi:hypothetical protein
VRKKQLVAAILKIVSIFLDGQKLAACQYASVDVDLAPLRLSVQNILPNM